MNVLVKYPTRARPELFLRTFHAYQQDETASFLVSIDRDDTRMNNPGMLKWLYEQPRTTFRVGESKSKVEAINDGVAEAEWQLLILASDDMVPQRPDYAQRIAELFGEFWPEGDGVLHLNDGQVGVNLNTLCILDRKYFDRFGYIYRPADMGGYHSTHCDNEFQAVSERLGRSVYVNEVIIRHEWIGRHAPDALHRRNESLYAKDEATFKRRRSAGFPN